MLRFLLITTVTLLLLSCSATKQTLQTVNQRFDTKGQAHKVDKGIYWYAWLGQDKRLKRNMSINLIDIDLKKADVTFDFAWFNNNRATLSAIADTAGAIVAVNSAYFEKLDDGGYVSFHKSKGHVDQYMELPENHTRFWKHQAAFVQTGDQSFAFIQGNQRLYDSLPYDNIISSAPLLIADGIPVGKYFVAQKTDDKSKLDGEHPDRHQAGNGPRMAFAKTTQNHLLLIAVDGRSARAQGINAEELTDLLMQLNATDAINMDGGGSLTMFVRGTSPTGVVNYPSDLRKKDPNLFEHYGQRKNGAALLIKPKSASASARVRAIKVAADPEAKDYIDVKH